MANKKLFFFFSSKFFITILKHLHEEPTNLQHDNNNFSLQGAVKIHADYKIITAKDKI